MNIHTDVDVAVGIMYILKAERGSYEKEEMGSEDQNNDCCSYLP